MATIKKFGQEVILTVHDASGDKVVLDASELRVDFDVRLIDGYNRGKFDIYNLSDISVGAISSEELYVTLKTRLHDREQFTLVDSYFISNVLEEKKVPVSITSLYCYDKLRKDFLEKPVTAIIDKPTLRKEVVQLCDAVQFDGNISFLNFPLGQLDQQSGRLKATYDDSLEMCLKRIQSEHGFNLYTADGDIHCMFKPDGSNLGNTDLESLEPTIILHTHNMRSNIKLGPATLNVTSNLDPNIVPTAILDISNLITAGASTDEETLQLADNFLKDSVAGFTKYQTLAVQHKGSNYTALWESVATATSPSKGTRMPVISWFK